MEYANNPFVIAQNDSVVSVNVALQVDLHDASHLEFVNGWQLAQRAGKWIRTRAYASRLTRPLGYPAIPNQKKRGIGPTCLVWSGRSTWMSSM